MEKISIWKKKQPSKKNTNKKQSPKPTYVVPFWEHFLVFSSKFQLDGQVPGKRVGFDQKVIFWLKNVL